MSGGRIHAARAEPVADGEDDARNSWRGCRDGPHVEPGHGGCRKPADIPGGGRPAGARFRALSSRARSAPGVAVGRGARPLRHGGVHRGRLADRGRVPPARGRRRGPDRLGLGVRLSLLSRARQASQRGARRRLLHGAAAARGARRHDRPDHGAARQAALARARQHGRDVHRAGASRAVAVEDDRVRVAPRCGPTGLRPRTGDGRDARAGEGR